ncbi:MAG TPA: ribosome biogenesis GTP-binding protein YihA/YsxC [Gammaproteobacteria bacterium]|nr:ribosome biogenesis GTP-binding protein YihA/YsxC [Gammaproteobacteria bacterium]
MLIPFQKTTFIMSVAKLIQLPDDEGCEIAFAGRSNAGKSTALNAITGVKGLARTSKTPGRTQTINLFRVTDEIRLVDLPGYGFAQVPLAMKKEWDKLLAQYLQNRESLRGLCLVMDSRHPLKEFDIHILEWAVSANLPTHILLSKADKLSKTEKTKVLQYLKDNITDPSGLITYQLFSALRNEGIVDARKKISQWI